MAYFILAISVSFAVANNFFLRRFNNRDIKNIGDSLAFNSGISIIWGGIILICGMVSNGGWLIPSTMAAFYGVLYGLNLSMFLLFKCQSIVFGPLSLSSLIGACGFIIATIFSAIYNREQMGFLQILGMCLMVVSIYMCINPEKSKMKLTTRWKVYAFFFFCSGGMIGVINKLFQASAAKEETDAMMLVASLTSAVILSVVGLLINKVTGEPVPKVSYRNIKYIGLCGFVSCIYNRLNVYLAGVLPGMILFPVSNGCLIFASSILGVLFFGEKLSANQKFGIMLGFISVVLIGCC